MATVLVTGGAGYIGSHTCKALAGAGFLPVTYDDLSTGKSTVVKWGPLEKGELADRKRLQEVFTRHSPEAVLHFAAKIDVGESVRDPMKYYQNNVLGSLTLLEAARNAGVKKFIFSSSAAVYGVPQTVPIPESHPKQPINPYGASKLTMEEFLNLYQNQFGFRTASLRYFNAAGADPDGETGPELRRSHHLIPIVLDVALGRRPEVAVFGTDYPTRDGTCVRDYVHVSDLAAAHLQALLKLETWNTAQAFNLGTQAGYTVQEVLAACEREINRKISHRLTDRRPGDPPELVADPKLAGDELNWKPRYSDLKTIISTTWKWAKEDL